MQLIVRTHVDDLLADKEMQLTQEFLSFLLHFASAVIHESIGQWKQEFTDLA